MNDCCAANPANHGALLISPDVLSYTTRPPTDADLPAILELLKASLGEGQGVWNSQYWRWKHFQNPFGLSPILVAVTPSGAIIGLRAFMRWKWQSGDQVVASVRAVDTATHPAWRGRGIFRRLTLELVEKMRNEGVAFVFNTPNRKSGPGYLKMGWIEAGRIPVFARPIRLKNCVRQLLLSSGALGVWRRKAEAQIWTTEQLVSPAVPGANSIEELLEQPGIGELIATRADSNSFCLKTPLSPEYIRWRYAAIPGFRYQALCEFVDSRSTAAMIFRIKQTAGLIELRICELLVTPGSFYLVRRLFDMLHKSTADFISVVNQGRDFWRFLLTCGFITVPRAGPVLALKFLKPSRQVDSSLRARGFCFETGDLELF
jgi:hypothetical protein